jgi:hypothetical protein
MTAIPKPYRHLQIFSVCLGLLVVALGVFLFGVKIEHSVAGSGVIFGGDAREVLAPVAGRVRLIAGNDSGAFTALHPGTVGLDSYLLLEIEPPDGTHPVAIKLSEPGVNQPRHLAIAECGVRPGEAVQAGQKLATLVALRSPEGDVENPLVRAEFDEKQFAEVKVGQAVRIKSSMYPSRTHGHAEGVVSSVQPVGVVGERGRRKFVAEVKVNQSPFRLLHGSSVEVEVLLGRKETFRVILEH